MEDLSELFRRGFQTLHKSSVLGQSVQERKTLLSDFRREKRSTLAFQNRNIDHNMSPVTPQVERRVPIERRNNENVIPNNEAPDNQKPVRNKRLEMLAQWKKDKAKKELEKAKNVKPLFKVCHVQSSFKTDIETANKFIKGKPISLNNTKHPWGIKPDHQFKFKAPTFKPIVLQSKSKNENKNLPIESIKKGSRKEPLTHEKELIIKLDKVDNCKSHLLNKKPQELKGSTSINQNKDQVLERKKRTNLKNSTNAESCPTTKVVPQKVANNIRKKPNTAGTVPQNTYSLRSKINTRSTAKDTNGVSKVAEIHKKNVTGRLSKSLDIPSESKELHKKVPSSSVSSKDKIGNNGYFKNNENTSRKVQKLDNKKAVPVKKFSKPSNKCISRVENSSDDEVFIKSESVKNTPLPEKIQRSPLSSNTENIISAQQIENELKKLEEAAQEKVFYISPHVTIARGKTAARREFRLRISTGGTLPDTPEFNRAAIQATTPKAASTYFTHKLSEEVARIERLCLEWEQCKGDREIPTEAHDCIDVAIGQSKLLIAKKFAQFRGLIVKCREQNSNDTDRPVTCEDLHGFWDMMYMQIEDVDKRFENLQTMKDNAWHELLPQEVIPAKKPSKNRPKKNVKSSASSKLKDAIRAARQKKMQNGNQLGVLEQRIEEKVFEGGYFEVRSPVSVVKHSTNSCDRRTPTLRRSTLMSESMKKCSLSPALAMMSVSSSIKHGNGITPSKSILKNAGRSSIKSNKSVAFRDEIRKSIVKVRLFEADN